MSAASLAPSNGGLLFEWERPRRRRYAIVGFLVASAILHALCFYIFQVVYPPAISLLPPPAQVTVISPDSKEGRSFLNWLNTADPALASQTQRPPDARAFQLPKLAHVPSYLSVPPTLKELPPRRIVPIAPVAMPPGPVPIIASSVPVAPLPAPTTLHFSEPLKNAVVAYPEMKFRAATREAPESARFRIAVDSLGVVRYTFLAHSSGDAALDAAARRILALSRFQLAAPPAQDLVWASATFEFGNDLELPPKPAERAP